MRIGDVLREARERAGLGLRDAEAETKIRIKYLEALEREQWDELPSAAYAKGFLRTYGQLLGLDGDALVDEYRRQVERGQGAQAYPLADRPARARRPAHERGRRLGLALAAAAIAGLAVVGVIAGGSDDDEPREPRTGARDGQRRGGGDERGAAANRDRGRSTGPATLLLRVRRPVEVCLVGGGGEALVDRQVLAAGSVEQFTRRRFELRFPEGVSPKQLRVLVEGEPLRPQRSTGPAAYEILGPKRVRAVKPPARESCP